MPIEVSARIGAVIVRAAEKRGVDPATLRDLTGFDVSIASNPDARIAIETEELLWNDAARLARDEDFGLHAAEGLRPGAFDVLDYAVRSAPTARAALQRIARYNRLEHDIAVFTLIDRRDSRDDIRADSHDVLRVEHAFRLEERTPSRHASEFTLAALVVVGAQITGAPFRPLAVDFIHHRPSSIAEHDRIFGVEPRFGCRVNAIDLDRSLVDRSCPAADPALSRVIERHAEALLAALPDPTETFASRVRRLLAPALREGDASLARIAADLKMSERSVQRRLSDENLSFDALLDSLRHDLALRYLSDPHISISEVAYLTGYSEPSAFHRAFKRWTGRTPSDLRRPPA
jgi:AraC-like DNA-binding protein